MFCFPPQCSLAPRSWVRKVDGDVVCMFTINHILGPHALYVTLYYTHYSAAQNSGAVTHYRRVPGVSYECAAEISHAGLLKTQPSSCSMLLIQQNRESVRCWDVQTYQLSYYLYYFKLTALSIKKSALHPLLLLTHNTFIGSKWPSKRRRPPEKSFVRSYKLDAKVCAHIALFY